MLIKPFGNDKIPETIGRKKPYMRRVLKRLDRWKSGRDMWNGHSQHAARTHHPMQFVHQRWECLKMLKHLLGNNLIDCLSIKRQPSRLQIDRDNPIPG